MSVPCLTKSGTTVGPKFDTCEIFVSVASCTRSGKRDADLVNKQTTHLTKSRRHCPCEHLVSVAVMFVNLAAGTSPSLDHQQWTRKRVQKVWWGVVEISEGSSYKSRWHSQDEEIQSWTSSAIGLLDTISDLFMYLMITLVGQMTCIFV